MPRVSINLSVIIPVYNAARELGECLSAIVDLSRSDVEIIVVDDASMDATAAVAVRMGARLLRLEKNSGPSAARNFGAKHAAGEILLFVDADVVVCSGLVDRVIKTFEAYPNVAAVFGSYDAFPRAPTLVSQYRNLLHHYVHQEGKEEASTFWAGCGAIRRSVFESIGGFDEQRFPRPSIEDIELGMRLRRAQYRIYLDKGLQVTHLKQWTIWSVLRTDIFCRAVPWSRLMLESKMAPNDLNIKTLQRISGALGILTLLFLVLSFLKIGLLTLAALSFLGVICLNIRLYTFFLKRRGVLFAAACIPLHFLYFVYSTLSYLFVWVTFYFRAAVSQRTGWIVQQQEKKR